MLILNLNMCTKPSTMYDSGSGKCGGDSSSNSNSNRSNTKRFLSEYFRFKQQGQLLIEEYNHQYALMMTIDTFSICTKAFQTARQWH